MTEETLPECTGTAAKMRALQSMRLPGQRRGLFN